MLEPCDEKFSIVVTEYSSSSSIVTVSLTVVRTLTHSRSFSTNSTGSTPLFLPFFAAAAAGALPFAAAAGALPWRPSAPARPSSAAISFALWRGPWPVPWRMRRAWEPFDMSDCVLASGPMMQARHEAYHQ